MLCMRCRGHATFDQTVFQGTTPTKVRLCPDCADSVGADDHLARIKAAPDHSAKMAAVNAFLSAVDVAGASDPPGAQAGR